jgi:hypothetical protein
MIFKNIFKKYEVHYHWISTLILHIIITFIFTIPFLLYFNSHFVGGPRGDKFQFIWNFWWVKHSILDLHKFPFFCNLQYYPTGVSLALHDMTYFWSILSVPFQFFLDPALILNLFLFLCFPLNGMAFYHMAKEITKEHRGALAGSLIFAFCPYLIGRFHVCHIQYLSVFFIPLFLLELWRYSQYPSLVNLIKASIYFFLTSLISYYYGAALSLILISFFIYQAICLKNKSSYPGRLIKLSFNILITFSLIIILMSPFMVPALIQINRGDYQSAKEPFNSIEDNSGDLVSYFIPDTTLASWKGWSLSKSGERWMSRFNASISGNILEKSVYPGLISLISIGMAIFFKAFREKAWPWLLLALSFWIISLGPTLFVFGKPYLKGLLPYSIFRIIPIFNIMRAPTRFAFFITLGGGMLVALGISQLRKNFSLRSYRILTVIITAVILVEFLPTPTYLTPNNIFISNFYYYLQKDPDEFSILNIPVDFFGATGGGDIYVYAQTIHEKPIIGGYVSREPVYALSTLNESDFLQAITSGTNDESSGLPLTEKGYKEMPDTLKCLNIGYVILHKSLLSYDDFLRAIKWIEPGLGRPIFEDEWIRVYSA